MIDSSVAWVAVEMSLPPLGFAVEVQGDHTLDVEPYPIAWRATVRHGNDWEWLSLQWRGMVGVRAWRYPSRSASVAA